MINLLPKDRKKVIIRVYYLKVAALGFFLLSIAGLLALAFLAPAYNITIAKESEVLDETTILKRQAKENKEELAKSIETIHKKLAVFKETGTSFVFTEHVLAPVLLRKNAKIKITNIGFTNEKEKKNVVLSGIATDRAALLAFERDLKKEEHFKGIGVPISNFVEGSNINFTIQFTFE